MNKIEKRFPYPQINPFLSIIIEKMYTRYIEISDSESNGDSFNLEMNQQLDYKDQSDIEAGPSTSRTTFEKGFNENNDSQSAFLIETSSDEKTRSLKRKLRLSQRRRQ